LTCGLVLAWRKMKRITVFMNITVKVNKVSGWFEKRNLENVVLTIW